MPPPIRELSQTHYDVLQVSPTATEAVVRSTFKTLSLKCHPDRLQRAAPNATPSSKRKQEQAQVAARERWGKIEEAAAILSDPLHRLLYDLEIGVTPDTEENQARVHRLKRKDAQRAVATMEETVAAMRAQEESKNGLLILSARWGDLSVSEEDAARAVSAPYIDVAVPLQYLVSDSTLIFKGGQSHSWLEGFYDPSLGANSAANRLHVKYKFLNTMHQATFEDEEEVCIPMEEHVMEESESDDEISAAPIAAASAPINTSSSSRPLSSSSKRASTAAFAARSAASRSSVAAAASGSSISATSRATLLAQAKARRRMVVYAGLFAAGLGVYLVKNNKMPFSMKQIAEWIKRMIGMGGVTTAATAGIQTAPMYITAQPSAAATPVMAIAPTAPVAVAAPTPVATTAAAL